MEAKPTYTSKTRITYMADRPAFLLLEVEVKGEGIKCVFQDFNKKRLGWYRRGYFLVLSMSMQL